MQETEYNWLRWSSICGGEDNLEVMLYVRTRDGSTKATYLDGILKSTEVHELFASATYEGTNGLASARWTCSETDFLGRTISESRPGFGGSTLVTSNFYDSAGRIIATRSYSVASGSSPLAFAYDDDGNQTLITTKTGQWRVTYNGENRPILWVRDSDNTALVMSYDHMGRRRVKNGQRFFYDGYLQVYNIYSPASTHNSNCYIWDSTEPVATRPLYWQPRMADGDYSLFYTHDGNKNVSEVVFCQRARGIAAHYEYVPFGDVLEQTCGNAWGELDLSSLNPWRFSCEYAEDDTATVYYNYRYYNPMYGRWVSKDRVIHNLNSYVLICNAVFNRHDCLGLVDQTTIDLIFLAIETVSGNSAGMINKILLPTILDLLDESTLGFVHSAVNWGLFGKDIEVAFESYDPGWGPSEFDSKKYADSIKKVCDSGGDLPFAANRVVDTYREGLYAISTLGAPGQYTVSLNGGFWRTEMDNRCRWHFQGEVTIPKDRFDFNVNGGDRSLLGQFITEIVAFVQSKIGIGHDFDITFKGRRHVKDEGDCCE